MIAYPEYRPVLPAVPRLIVILGAGGIVRDAHLPAYRRAGFEVAAIADRNRDLAEQLARAWGIPRVGASVDELVALAPPDCVFDLALPPEQATCALARLPVGAAVLLQKPMGATMAQARDILAICRERGFIAAVNFQLRFAPAVMAAWHLINTGVIGELRDFEVRVSVETPWDHFPVLRQVERLEILYHCVHYLDCARHFLGNPRGVYAKTLRHPELAMPASRSAVILDYGDDVRANIATNHFHRFGLRHQESGIKWEGTRGAIRAKLGLLMNYPHGVPDEFEVCTFAADGSPKWESIALEGSWFPDAFIGSMAQVMRAADGDGSALVTSVEDAIHTMACVEAAYASSAVGGQDPAQFL
jgi:predicted dehydrogenase